MFRNYLVATLSAAFVALASASLTPYVEPVYEGYLSDETTYVCSFDLKVSVSEGDAWAVAGGPAVGVPWNKLYGGTFYQDPENDTNPPDPALCDFPPCDYFYTSFYTTHLGWPNTPDRGVSPGFGYGPGDTPTGLRADWFWTPDGNYYPGEFTIARFTVVPDDPNSWCAEIDMLIGSIEGGVISFTWSSATEGCCPADLDEDRDVDLADLARLLGNFGVTGGATYWDGDPDGDDDVDWEDLAELLSVYGTDCDRRTLLESDF
jgi:hypothetical protein